MFETVADSFYRALMWAGHFACRQNPARSPHLFGAQLPLCWRCTGVALGALALVAWLFRTRRLPAAWLSVALALVMPLDVLQAILTRGEGDNARRLLTGALWGFFASGLALHLFARVNSRVIAARARRGGAATAREDFSPAAAAKLPAAPREAT
ncbi:MAG TPA: DUF2085 domain-containing protein [Pyrinomonadaceae bacterium]|jgi:uncharacterized membrane protein